MTLEKPGKLGEFLYCLWPLLGVTVRPVGLSDVNMSTLLLPLLGKHHIS